MIWLPYAALAVLIVIFVVNYRRNSKRSVPTVEKSKCKLKFEADSSTEEYAQEEKGRGDNSHLPVGGNGLSGNAMRQDTERSEDSFTKLEGVSESQTVACATERQDARSHPSPVKLSNDNNISPKTASGLSATSQASVISTGYTCNFPQENISNIAEIDNISQLPSVRPGEEELPGVMESSTSNVLVKDVQASELRVGDHHRPTASPPVNELQQIRNVHASIQKLPPIDFNAIYEECTKPKKKRKIKKSRKVTKKK